MIHRYFKLFGTIQPLKRFKNPALSSRHGLTFKYRPFLGTSVIVGTYLGFLLLTDNDETPQYYPNELDATLFRRIPLNGISRLWGKIASINIPEFLRPSIYGSFAKFYQCNLEELDNPDLKCYSSLSEFFVRKLAPGTRTINSEALLVSPVDGQVLHFGQVAPENPVLEQVKGSRYSLTEFLGPIGIRPSLYNQSNKEKGNSTVALYQCVIYLAPGDCHRFHSPADWKPTLRRHFPGRLLSVKPGLVSRLSGLYALNERVVYLGEWMYGMMSLTAVGALGVGNICVNIDSNLNTNKSSDNIIRFRSINSSNTFTSFYIEKILNDVSNNYGSQLILKGEEFGQFRIGSTIVLVFEAPLKKHIKWTIKPSEHVKLGQALLISS